MTKNLLVIGFMTNITLRIKCRHLVKKKKEEEVGGQLLWPKNVWVSWPKSNQRHALPQPSRAMFDKTCKWPQCMLSLAVCGPPWYSTRAPSGPFSRLLPAGNYSSALSCNAKWRLEGAKRWGEGFGESRR